jgi:hypothetical protein
MPQGHATLERQSSQNALSIQQGGFSLLGIMISEHKTTAFQVC